MFGYIYITTNTINNHKYIGKHKAQKFDKNYKGSGKVLTEAFSKYGKSNFHTEIIEWCETEKLLNARERYWIAFYNAAERDDFYNLSNGGEGFGGLSGNRSPTKRPEVRAKMSKNHANVKGKNNPNYGVSMSEEQRKRISQTKKRNKDSVGDKNPMYGRTHTDEVKKRLSDFKKSHPTALTLPGPNNPNYGTRHINNGIISRKCKIEELQQFLDSGWKLGRIMKKHSSETIETITGEKSVSE